ncbi:MAG: DoxX family protein [Planctomycetota bacterium]
MNVIKGIVTVIGRICLAAIFLMSAAGNKIPNFAAVTEYMADERVPLPGIALAGAIVFLIAGGLSLIVGYRTRLGAALLLVFLLLATYFFHDFWTFADGPARQQQMIQFMKNLALMGAMLFILANGPGPWSLDAWTARRRRKRLPRE